MRGRNSSFDSFEHIAELVYNIKYSRIAEYYMFLRCDDKSENETFGVALGFKATGKSSILVKPPAQLLNLATDAFTQKRGTCVKSDCRQLGATAFIFS